MEQPLIYAVKSKIKYLSGDAPAHLAYLILCFSALAVSMIMSTNGTLNSVHVLGFTLPVRVPCIFRFITGFKCPACGMTRCFIYMSHFNIRAAFAMNRAGVLLYFLCVFEVPYRLVLLLRGKVPFQKAFNVFQTVLFGSFIAADAFFFLWQFIRLI
jgi:hypothetical protein